ncbi:hypothetical protein ACFFKJ_12865 [Pelagicoccus mobilis]
MNWNVCLSSLVAISLAASCYAKKLDTEVSYGELIFFDDFERQESQEIKDEPGNEWTTSSDKTAGGRKQVDLVDGVMHMQTLEGANHAVSTRHAFEFEDGSIGMKFMLPNDGDSLKLNFADMTLKSVHAGHLFDAVVGLDYVSYEDKKTGVMDLEIRKARREKSLSKEQSAMLKTKKLRVVHSIEKGVWHELFVHVDRDTIWMEIDGTVLEQFSSEGFAHRRKGLLRLLVPGHAYVDDVRIWRRK